MKDLEFEARLWGVWRERTCGRERKGLRKGADICHVFIRAILLCLMEPGALDLAWRALRPWRRKCLCLPRGTLKDWPSRQQERRLPFCCLSACQTLGNYLRLWFQCHQEPLNVGYRLILWMCKLRLREMRHPAQGYYLRPSRVTYCPGFPRTEEFLEMQDFEDRTRQAEGLVGLGCLPAELCYTNCSPNRADSSDFPKSWL